MVPWGQMVMEGKGTCSMGIWATDVITGFSFQAMKLLLITIAALTMPAKTRTVNVGTVSEKRCSVPRMTMMTQTNLPMGFFASDQK